MGTPIDSLLEERRGYVLRGLGDRVAQVDAAIAAAGGVPPSGEAPVVESAVSDAVVETADAPHAVKRVARKPKG